MSDRLAPGSIPGLLKSLKIKSLDNPAMYGIKVCTLKKDDENKQKIKTSKTGNIKYS